MLPGALGLLGASGAGLAVVPALRVLNYPFLALTVVLLGRGWYLQLRSNGLHRGTLWSRRSLIVLSVHTSGSRLMGTPLRGILGNAPFLV